MGQPTTQVTWTELETEIGRFLGYDRTVGNWRAAQVLDCAAIQKRGLRQFYIPPRVDPNVPAHRWSFLHPQATLNIWDDVIADDEITASSASYSSPVTTITASEAVFYPSMEEKSIVFDESGNSFVIDEYVSSTVVKVTGDASGENGKTITIDSGDIFTLPWDYGGMSGDGRFTYNVDENRLVNIQVTTESRIRALRQQTVGTGTPYLAAIIPLKPSAATQGQRWGVMFHPPPNDVFTLHYRYFVLADALVDSTAEYPYGSAAHSETILESCLAIAEIREKDDASTLHQDRFKILLQASIDHDAQLGEAVIRYGYNGDGSDLDETDLIPRRHNSLVTYNDVEY